MLNKTQVAALFLQISTPLFANDGPHRVRLTETSITETGRLSVLSDLKLKTRGYGLSYIHSSGFGGSYTFLRSTASEAIDLKHNYLDVHYTYGDRFLMTGGFGFGVSGEGKVASGPASNKATWSESKALTLGPGVSIGWFEIYWIHRRNWAAYRSNGHSYSLSSKHYMLGIGAKF